MNIKIYQVVFGLFLSVSLAEADTTISASDKYAWNANCGWIAFVHDRPSVPDGIVVGESYLSGLAYSSNTGWINFGSGAPSNGFSYTNEATDHGVNHDGSGNLSGYAWSANTGWINFGWADGGNPHRARIELSSGVFDGFVWSPNLGWINLGTGILRTSALMSVDSDLDGIADHWEFEEFGDLISANDTSDMDGDGSLDIHEYIADSDPNDVESLLKVVTYDYDLSMGEFTLNFTTSESRLYRIERSSDLGVTDPWVDSDLATFSPDTGGFTTKILTVPDASADKYFFRAVAIRPLAAE